MTFTCCSSQVYKSQKKGSGLLFSNIDSLYASNVRNLCPHNDRRLNDRTLGMSMTRKTETVRPLSSKDTCQFKFSISVYGYETPDGYWHMRGGVGCAHHSNHLRFTTNQLPNPCNLLTDYENEMINKVSNDMGKLHLR